MPAWSLGTGAGGHLRTYADLVRTLLPVAYWRLGEASGAVAIDQISNANPGTYVAAPTLGVVGLLTGDADTAITCNGTTQWVADDTPPDVISGTAAWTFAVWVNHTADANLRYAVSIGAATNDGVFLTSTNAALTIFRRNAAGSDSVAASAIGAGTHLLTATFDGTTLTLYRDGASVGTPVTGTRSPSVPTRLRIGSRFDGTATSVWNGTIDEPAIWNRALSASEIASLYAAGTTAPSVTIGAAAHPFSLTVKSVDVISRTGTLGTRFGVPLETISISEVAANGGSTISFRYEDPAQLYTLPAGSYVRFTHNDANEVLFSGYIVRRATFPLQSQQGYGVDVSCVDASMLLDLCIVPALKYKAGYSDKALIQGVVAHSIRHNSIYTHTAYCTVTNSNMPAMDFGHITLRAAIEAIQSAAGSNRHYYVDFLGRLHYYAGDTEAAMGSAPRPVLDTDSLTIATAADLQIEYDDSQLINAVWINGANPAGSGWVKDVNSIASYGLRQGSFDAPHSRTAAARNSVGVHFLARQKDPLVRGSFSISGSETGWHAGQSITVTSAALGLSAAVYPIRQIDTTFNSGTGDRTRTVHFGELPANRSRAPKSVPYSTTGPAPHAAPRPGARIVGNLGIAADRTRL